MAPTATLTFTDTNRDIYDLILNPYHDYVFSLDSIIDGKIPVIISTNSIFTDLAISGTISDSCSDCSYLNLSLEGGLGEYEYSLAFNVSANTGVISRAMTFNITVLGTLNSSLNSFIDMPIFNRNAFYAQFIIVNDLPTDVNCTIQMTGNPTKFLENKTNELSVQPVRITSLTSLEHTWNVNISEFGTVRYIDLFEPYFTTLAYYYLTDSKSELDISTKYKIICRGTGGVNSSISEGETSTTIYLNKITGTLGTAGKNNGDYSGKIELLADNKYKFTFYMKDKTQEFITYMTSVAFWFSEPINLVEWITSPTNIILMLVGIVVFSPIILGGYKITNQIRPRGG